MSFCAWFVLLSAISHLTDINCAERSLLKPGFGVNFKFTGQLLPGSNRKYVTLAFTLPRYEKIDNYDHLKLECLNVEDYPWTVHPPITWLRHTMTFVCEQYRA